MIRPHLSVVLALAACAQVPQNPAGCPGPDTARYTLTRAAPPVTHVVDRTDPALVVVDMARVTPEGGERVAQTLAHGLVAVDRVTARDRLALRLADDIGAILPLRPGARFESALTVTTAAGDPLPGYLTLNVGAPGEVALGPCRYATLRVETLTSVGPHATTLSADYIPDLGVVMALPRDPAAPPAFDRIEITPPPQSAPGVLVP